LLSFRSAAEESAVVFAAAFWCHPSPEGEDLLLLSPVLLHHPQTHGSPINRGILRRMGCIHPTGQAFSVFSNAASHPCPVDSSASKYLKKYILKLWHVFSPPQNRHQSTTIHHESTTSSPQKHHQKNAHFPSPPSKMHVKRQKKAPAIAGTFSHKIKY
jgi:hypothetical protein